MKKQILLLALFITPNLINAAEEINAQNAGYSIQDLIDEDAPINGDPEAYLSFNNLNIVSLKGLKNFPNIGKLVEINLSDNHITDIVGYFDNLPNLKLLNLSYNHISESDQNYIQDFCDAKGITLIINNQTEDPNYPCMNYYEGKILNQFKWAD